MAQWVYVHATFFKDGLRRLISGLIDVLFAAENKSIN